MQTINQTLIREYAADLNARGRAPGTIEKYLRDARAFAAWLDGRAVTRETAAEWRAHLLEQGLQPVTVNSMLAAVNGFFRFLGWTDCRVSFLKIQRRLFRESSRELSRSD